MSTWPLPVRIFVNFAIATFLLWAIVLRPLGVTLRETFAG